MWESVWGECEGYGEVCWGVGKSEGKCAGVWGDVRRGVGNVGEGVGKCVGVRGK